ncbi:MAG: SLBB domain-containing protein [Chloroflexi bacterium]|nr:SLBB domain-containing protein [Chloroflexota bacterium]
MDRRTPVDTPATVEETRSSRLRPILATTLLVVVAVAFAILMAREWAFAPAPVEIQLPPSEPAIGAVTVHVGGAVMEPGVYSLSTPSRVVDAIELAGGLIEGADTNAVNMAEELEDGTSYVVPLQEDTPPENNMVVVHVRGEVREPGLYELPQGSRFTDALAVAGGLTDRADESGLNLAEVLQDGARYDVSALADSENGSVFVHVVGAIAEPGTYTLGHGARLTDVIDMAGGISAGANTDAVDLALQLVDGQRYYVPYKGEEAVGEVTVHIAGAVATPGLYTLPNGTRLIDAILAAGGTLSTADMHALNLAQPVQDGARYAIPVLRATVNVNIAGAGELESVPGISRTVAQAIVNYREASGAFTEVDQLLDVPGIGPSTLAAIRPFVSVN